MPKQVWICEKCHSKWIDEQSAKECEARHVEPISFKVQSWVKYDRGNILEQVYPDRIRVEMPPRFGEHGFAIYKLHQIGPKGL